jgi:hypothetical protein
VIRNPKNAISGGLDLGIRRSAARAGTEWRRGRGVEVPAHGGWQGAGEKGMVWQGAGENGMVKGWVRGSPGLDELGSCKKQVPLKMVPL